MHDVSGRPRPAHVAGAGSNLGLTTSEALRLLHEHGPNTLPQPRRQGQMRKLAAQFTHFFARMLWAAGVLAIIAGMAQLGVAIFVVVVVNGVFAWAQEARAEHAAERLRELVPRRATVMRDGEPKQIDAADIVVGDRLRLEAGDRVPADSTLVETEAFSVDTSMLTGESVPEQLSAGDLAAAGCHVVAGDAWATVTATGPATELARISLMTASTTRPRTPLALELDRVVRKIAAIAVVIGVVFFGAALLFGEPPSDGFLFAIGVTVALVPEGLLPTITMALALGAQRMARRMALVRRLDAVETLGSTTMICTDKTGTLTKNEMVVVEAWTPQGSARIDGPGYAPKAAVVASPAARAALADLARDARTCSDGRIMPHDDQWEALGDPMEAAIDALAHRCAVAEDEVVLARAPFDNHRRRMSVVVARGETRVLIVKGAPEAVLSVSAFDGEGAKAQIDRLARQGLRVLVVASRALTPAESSDDCAAAEHSLQVVGLLGFLDPPRPTVVAALSRCRQLGVGVIMITGDHPATAAAIAKDIGLSTASSGVIRGDQLPDDETALGELVDVDGTVVSRVDPEQKVRIARALQARGHVVAMTGDGVNDGPALQTASVSVAMGRSGTDVAREASDLVLLDDDFATIVAAIEEGRATYSNIRRFLTYHLTDNVAELTPFVVWALSAGQIPLALGVLQILCLDIGTDILPALALGTEAPHGNSDRAGAARLFDRLTLRRAFLVLGPTEAVVEMAAFFAALAAAGWRIGDSFPSGDALRAASGAAFLSVVVCQMANAFACRSTSKTPWRLGMLRNRLVVIAVVVELIVAAGFLTIGPVARLLEHEWPPLPAFAVAAAGFPAVLLVDALDKRARARRQQTAVSTPQ
jgi:calcium-translocating P-type ATPase